MGKPEMKVSVRGGFSDRNGIKEENRIMQFESLDDRTRIALFNLCCDFYHRLFDGVYTWKEKEQFWDLVFSKVYLLPLKYDKNYDSSRCMEVIKKTILNDDYDDVLTLVEFLVFLFESFDKYRQLQTEKAFNRLLREEYVGYRFVHKKIVPITNENELRSINDSLTFKKDTISDHFDKAILLLSDRANPDYENSIKESITAVEAMCESVTGEHGSLSQCLSKLQNNGVVIHPALEEAYKKLYGYTCDANGIRHAGKMDGTKATLAEAKYMLVSCSAFVNYLREVST